MPVYPGIWDLMLAHRESLWRGMVVFFSLKLNSSTYSNHLFFEESIMTAVGNMWRWLRDSLLLFSRYILSNSLWPHRLQYARLPCPSLSPRVCSNSCPLSQWCSPTFSSSVVPFSSSVVPFSSCPLFPSTRVFSNESALHIRWQKYWNFSMSPSNEFRVDFL